MQLRLEEEIHFTGHEPTWRQSRAVAVIRTVVLGVVFGGAGPLWYYLEAPWFVVIMCCLTAMLVVPFFVYNAVATWRASNWMLRLDRDRLWLNMRSYSHHNLEPAATVIEAACNEIEEIRKERTTFVGPTDTCRGEVKAETSTVLHIRFREPVPTEIVDALAAERARLTSHHYFGFVKVSGRSHDDPVSLTDDHTLTLLWMSQNVIIRPSLDRAMEDLANRNVAVGTAERKEWLWSSLSPAEQDEMIAELESRGQVIEARRLIERREPQASGELSA